MTDVVSELLSKTHDTRGNDIRLSHDFVCRLAQEVRNAVGERELFLNHTAPLLDFVSDEAADDLAMVISRREANAIAAEIDQLRKGA